MKKLLVTSSLGHTVEGIYIYKKIKIKFFYKSLFSAVFSALYSQRSVTAALATPSPWSIYIPNNGHCTCFVYHKNVV